ncbi:MAG: manganese-dependent inorganic pyrophosphatase [Holophagaceae bacterium]|nr:manganese-dependent inorganic pyrophosphatase [Holophagaceae bacterium]
MILHVIRTICRKLLPASLILLPLAFAPARADESPRQESILVFGHANPDTDSVVGAMATAHLLSQTGRPSQAAIQGPVNAETAFVLKRFHLVTPSPLGSIAGRRVVLVDFTEPLQGPADLGKAKQVLVVDHHKPAGLAGSEPLEAWVQAVGSVNTILFEKYRDLQVPIPKELAGGMLCAILSDTVMYRSVTTTPRDRDAGTALAGLAGVPDQKALGMEMFKIKSALEGASARSLVLRDYKDFTMSGVKVGIGQLELVDLALVAGQRGEILAAMVELRKEKGLHSVFLMLTDILRETTEMLVVTDDVPLVQKAFKGEIKNNAIWLPGVMSRKKQVVPNLEGAFKLDREAARAN